MTHSKKGVPSLSSQPLSPQPLLAKVRTATRRGGEARLFTYAVAVLSVALALGSTLLLGAWMRATPTPLFFVAVMVSAWYGGLGPGLLATALSTIAVNYFLIEPYASLHIVEPGTIVQLVIFALAAALVSGLNQSRRVALRQAKFSLQTLRESETRFSRLAETNILGILVADLNGSVLDANDAFLQLVGYTREALQSGQIYWRDLTPPQSQPLSQQCRQELNRSGVCAAFEQELVRKDGSLVPILLGAARTGEDTMIGFVLDLSERKRTEGELQKSEARFRQMAETIEDVFWLFDPQSRQMLYISPAYEKIWGRFCESLYHDFSQWIETIHPDDRPQVQTAISQCIAKGSHEIEYRVMRPDGSLRWMRDRGFLIRDEPGQPERITGVAQDITDRKQADSALLQSEERYRCLVELIPQLVWSANSAGVLLDVNQRWVDFTGLTLAEAQLEGWQGFVHPDDVPALSQQWAAAQHNNLPYQAEGRMRRADGAYRWHLHQALPLKNAQGQVMKWFGTATDIEDQKQLERQRDRLLQQEQTARESAERANRIKDEFLAVLSHELRSPLNPILGWAKLLQSQKLNEAKTKQALQTIERNAKLQTQLIEDLLDVSRILRGKLALNTSPVNLAGVIEAALETVRLSAEAKQIPIRTTFPSKVIQVSGDASRLQQIVWNLLSNAVKFTSPGGQVEVRLERVGIGQRAGGRGQKEGDGEMRRWGGEEIGRWGGERQAAKDGEPQEDNLQSSLLPSALCPLPSELAQITVSDTGKGISPEFLPYVFDYFRQEDGKTTRKFGGLGLGLAIVRQLTELHGGTVAVESPGEELGATFVVRIPLLESREWGVESRNQPDSLSLPAAYAPLTDLRVLIVDDDNDMRDLIVTILEQAGATVRATASAAEALTAFESFQPHLLVSDIGMPDVDGYMLMRQIRDRSPEQGGQVPAIALTAYAGEINQQQALAAGFHRHVAKPVEPTEFVAIAAHLCGRNV